MGIDDYELGRAIASQGAKHSGVEYGDDADPALVEEVGAAFRPVLEQLARQVAQIIEAFDAVLKQSNQRGEK